MTTTYKTASTNENRTADGRYAGCPCELCNKPAGVEYMSAEYALAHGYVALCERCATDEVYGKKKLAAKLARAAKAAASFVPHFVVSFRKSGRSPNVYGEQFATAEEAHAFAATVKILVDVRYVTARFRSQSILGK
jgi:hypothetical protein